MSSVVMLVVVILSVVAPSKDALQIHLRETLGMSNANGLKFMISN
jgi:hypothetical protein